MAKPHSTLLTLALALLGLLPLAAADSLPAAATPDPAVLKREWIYASGPHPSVHASSLVEVQGRLLAVWFGGSAEGNKDVCIWLSQQDRNGQWQPCRQVADGQQPDGSRHPTWNPVLFQPSRGPLLLFYKVGPSPSTWWGELKTSNDGGQTWSPAQRLPEGILGPIKNKPIELPNGDLLCPSSSETPTRPSRWSIAFERSPDQGKTWSSSGSLHDGLQISAIQPSLLQLGGGQLLALGRSRQGRLFRISSSDEGRSWGKIELTDLPNPNSGTDAITLRDGRHLLIYNHTQRGRSPLNLALSQDGKEWQAALVLENQPKTEFSYPAIIQTADGMVHLSYTWKRQRVAHVVIDPSRLKPHPMPKGQWPQE